MEISRITNNAFGAGGVDSQEWRERPGKMIISNTAFVSLVVVMTMLGSAAFAQTTEITHVATPGQVPDEVEPRPNVSDAAPGYGGGSWQGPATGKSNWHARYDADGDYLSTIFPDDAATLTINDIAEISYYTNRPTDTPAGRDWWIQIYTRDETQWYGDRFINNYNDHSDTDAWVLYSTAEGEMTFNHNGTKIGTTDTNGEMTLSQLQTNYGGELVEMISVQTDSGWNGYDGYIDGLRIELTNGNIGHVNFEAVPEPGSLLLLVIGGAVGMLSRRRRPA